ncbi:MAG: phage tail length tape measure family protein [Deltaproteobacteria bacterium]|nr:phage tail length tape measure family protein [Deltaproteobacteria bacterium]
MAKKDPTVKIKAEDKTGKAFKSAQDKMRNLASSAAILEGPLGKVAGRINAMGAALGRMNPAMIAAGVSTAALGVVAFSSTKAAADLEQQMLRLDAVLLATGRNSETSTSQVAAMARTLGEATLTSAEAVRVATAALSTFENIGTDQMEEILILVQDMSAVFGGDLRQNAIKLARALDNPREGLSGLSRNILATSVAWRKYNADMFESGKKTEAQGQIIEAIQAKVAGAGVGEAGGLNGALDTMGERWTTVLEALGNTASLQAATWVVQGLSDKLRALRDFLEEDAKALSLYTEKLAPFTAVLQQMGIRIDLIDPTNLRDVNIVLKQLTLLGVDLAEAKPFVELNNQMQAAAQRLDAMTAARDGQIKIMGAEHRAIATLNANIAAQEDRVRALTAAYFNLAKGTKDSAELGAILRLKADKEIEKLTKKSLTQVESAQARMLELREELGAAGVEGAEKRKEVEAAYLAFVLSLHKKETDSAQIKNDKLLHLEENKTLKMQEMLGKAQGESGFDGPEQFDAGGPSERESIDSELALELTKRDARLAFLRETGDLTLAVEQEIEDQKLALVATSEEKKRVLFEESKQAEIDAKTSAIGHVGGLLAILGKENKLAAIASIALSKGLAIAQVFAHTEVAAMAALKYGPEGAPVAASIRSMGAVSMAAIAASGLVQVAAMSGGGGSAGGGGGSFEGGGTDIQQLDGAENRALQIVFTGNFTGWDQQVIDQVVEGIADAVDNRDVQLISADSRNGQELAAAVGDL